MIPRMAVAGVILLLASRSAAFSSQETMTYTRRSDMQADLWAGDAVVYDGDVTLLDFRLSDLQVSRLNDHELMLLRNSIFARCGYLFQDDTILRHFEEFDWYAPDAEDVTDRLSDTDLWNLDLIRLYENGLNSDESGIPDSTGIEGFWHGMIHVGSGYFTRIFFFPSGEFIYRCNTMDGSARLRELSGEWYIDGCHVVINADSALYFEGGYIVEPYASYGSEYVIENFTEVPMELLPNEVFRLPIDDYTDNYAETCADEEFENITVPYMRLGSCEYWRTSRDPYGHHLH